MSSRIEASKHGSSLVRVKMIEDLWKIDNRASKGMDYNYIKAKTLAEEIIYKWSLGPIGRLKSGLYWIGKIVVIFPCIKRYIDRKRVESVVHSALAHCSKKEIQILRANNLKNRASISDFGDDAAAVARCKGLYNA